MILVWILNLSRFFAKKLRKDMNFFIVFNDLAVFLFYLRSIFNSLYYENRPYTRSAFSEQ